MSLTLRQVRYFVATAEIGQISQAAIHLNISQSAVTTAIKELEAMLGVLLFQRSAQGMNLTEAGRHFLNRAYVIQRPSVRVRTSSVEAVRSMVANGSGVAILSDLVHRPWSLEGKRIETVTISDPVTPMSVGLAWHRERAFSPAMQAVRNYFHDAFLAPQQLSARR